jgi:hypothetical protein
MAITSELRLLRRNKNMRTYDMKLFHETKKNRNYVTLWRIQIQEVKIGVYIVENTLRWLFCQFQSTVNYAQLRYISFPKMAITRNT